MRAVGHQADLRMSQSRILTGRRYRGKGSRAEEREKRTFDGITFDSILEMYHYRDTLKPLHNARAIRALIYHPVFKFVLKDPLGEEFEVGQYEADFSYIETDTEKLRVQDVKAWERHPRTGRLRFLTGPDYLWQKPLMKICFGIDVEEV